MEREIEHMEYFLNLVYQDKIIPKFFVLDWDIWESLDEDIHRKLFSRRMFL